WAGAHHDAGGVAADDVVGQVVAGVVAAGAAEALEEVEGGDRFEPGRPDVGVVDRAGGDGDEGLVGRELGQGYLADADGAAHVPLLAVGEEVDVLGPQVGGEVSLGEVLVQERG